MTTPLTPFWSANGETFAGRSAWDVVTIAGSELPGLASLSGGLGRRIEVKPSAGNDGATLTHLGTEPASFQVSVRLWTEDHLALWELLAPTLAPARGKRVSKPVSVSHPALALHGVSRAYLLRVDLMREVSPGVMETVLHFIEWRPTSPTPGGVHTPTSPATSPTPRATVFDQPTAAPPPSQSATDP